MTTSLNNYSQFDTLLLEAWDRCTKDKMLAGLPIYELLNRWLANLTYACPRPNDGLDSLKALVSALRNCDEKALEDVLKNRPTTNCLSMPKKCHRKEPKAPKGHESMLSVKNENVTDCYLLASLSSMDNCITMQQFFREVAVHTCDKGALLMRITKDVLSDFQSFIEGVFSNRVTQIAMVLGREQMVISERYAKLEARTMCRAQLTLLHIKYVMPSFVWQRYMLEKGYMKSIIVSKCIDEDVQPEIMSESVDDLRGKSLLYHLNWLRTEIERAEFENQGLYEQHTDFTSQLATIEQNIADIQCRMASEMTGMTVELENLRSQSADQVCLIDRLMDKIHMTLQNSKANAFAKLN